MTDCLALAGRSLRFALLLLLAPGLAQAQEPRDPRAGDAEWIAWKDAQLSALQQPESAVTSATVTNPLTQLSLRGLTDSSNDYYLIGEFRNDTTLTLSFAKIYITLRNSLDQVLETDYTYFHTPTAARFVGSSSSTGVIPPGGVAFFRMFTSTKASVVASATYTTEAEMYATVPMLATPTVATITIGAGTSLQTYGGTVTNTAQAVRVFFPEVAVAGYLGGQINEVDFTYAHSSTSASICGISTDATIAPQSAGSFSGSFLRQVATIGRVGVEWNEISLSPGGQSFTASGGPGAFTVAGECSSWTVASNASWIVITNANSSTGLVSYSVSASTGVARTGTITAAGLTFTVTQQSPVPISNAAMSIDGPAHNSIVQQPFLTGGWAVDLGAPSGTGVDAVHVWAFKVVNGVVNPSLATFVAEGQTGGIRSDVGAVFGARFANSGFTFIVQGLAPGTYDLGVYARSTVTNTFNDIKFVRITIPAPVHDSWMSIDGPQSGQLVTQPFITGGWAIDRGAPNGTGVDAVHVWAFPVVNGVVGAGQFVAAATLGGPRSDVGAYFGNQFANSGFNFLMAGLSSGQTYFIGVYAHSSVSGAFDPNNPGQTRFALIFVK